MEGSLTHLDTMPTQNLQRVSPISNAKGSLQPEKIDSLVLQNFVKVEGKNCGYFKFLWYVQSEVLSKEAIWYLIRIFHLYDTDQDGALIPLELNDVFSFAPGWYFTFTIGLFIFNIIYAFFSEAWHPVHIHVDLLKLKL